MRSMTVMRSLIAARFAPLVGTHRSGQRAPCCSTAASLRLRVGALADLVAYRLDSVTFTPRNDPLRQLVYAERGAGIDLAIVGGDVVVRSGVLTYIDEAALLAEIEAEFCGLADRYRDAEASAAPLLAAVEAIYRRSLAVAIPADTLVAKLPGPEANRT